MMVKVGDKVRFDPFITAQGFGSEDNKGNFVIGTVLMVNDRNKWFSVEYDCGGVKQRYSFKFCDIGTEVTMCG